MASGRCEPAGSGRAAGVNRPVHTGRSPKGDNPSTHGERYSGMTAFKLLVLACSCLLLLGMARGRAAEKKGATGFLDRVHKDPDEKEAKFVLFVPEHYKAEKAYPLILFLHGAGETGTDGKKAAQVGLGPAIKKQQQTFS